MPRRSLLVSAAAAGLVLAPTAAVAYYAPGYAVVVSDATPGVDVPFTFAVDGDRLAGETVLLTLTSDPASVPNDAIEIAGTATPAQVAGADGAVSFSVTLSEPGTYDAVASVDGVVISTELLVVTPVASSPSSATGAATHVPGHDLTAAGSAGDDLAAGAGAVVVAGAGAVVLARRRQPARLAA